MEGLFITATGTGVGKTILSAALLAAMAAEGQRVRAYKPVVTGLEDPAEIVARGHWPADHELLGEMAVLFAAECPKQMLEIREAIARQDAAVLERAAHTLRGSVSNFCAPAAVAAVEELEALGRKGVLEGAAVAYEALERALEHLKPALARLTEGKPAAPSSEQSMHTTSRSNP